MKDIASARIAAFLLIICLLAVSASAQDIMQTMASVSNLLYGIAAGVAVLMLAYGAFLWKTTDDPGARESGKRVVLAVLAGIALIIVASSAVNMTYKKTTDTNVSVTVARITTTTVLTTTSRRPTTTSTTLDTSTTTTSTTTTTRDTFLTAANLAYCINKQATLVTNPSGCSHCIALENVWIKSAGGQAAYNSLKKCEPPFSNLPPCGSGCPTLPGFCGGGRAIACDCNTFATLNIAFKCGLTCKPGYVYYNCGGNGATQC